MTVTQVQWWVSLAPLLVALAGGIAAVFVDALHRRALAISLVAAALAGAAGLCVWLYATAPGQVVAEVLVADHGFFGIWFSLFAISAIAVIGGGESLARHPEGGGMAALLTFAAAASAALASSLDLLLSLVALEIIAVCGYALVSAARTPASAEASMKYAIQGATATGLFVLGLAIAAGLLASGSSLLQMAAGVEALTLPATLAAVLIVIGLAFKLGAFPMHSWAPDAYETAPPVSSAMLASVPKIGALSAVFLIAGLLMYPAVQAVSPTMQPKMVFGLLAAGSIVIGNLGALRQESYTRMLGYSGIAQVGYALVGTATGGRSFALSMLLMAAYGLAAAAAFLVAEAIQQSEDSWDGSISAMAGLASRKPLLAASTAVAMFSLTGIPLTAGFWGKLLVFGTATTQGLTWLAVVGVLGSVVSFGYYGRVLKTIYFMEPAAETRTESDQDRGEVAGEALDPADDASSDESEAVDGADEPMRGRLAVITAAVVAIALLAVGIVPIVTGLGELVSFFSISG